MTESKPNMNKMNVVTLTENNVPVWVSEEIRSKEIERELLIHGFTLGIPIEELLSNRYYLSSTDVDSYRVIYTACKSQCHLDKVLGKWRYKADAQDSINVTNRNSIESSAICRLLGKHNEVNFVR